MQTCRRPDPVEPGHGERWQLTGLSVREMDVRNDPEVGWRLAWGVGVSLHRCPRKSNGVLRPVGHHVGYIVQINLIVARVCPRVLYILSSVIKTLSLLSGIYQLILILPFTATLVYF